MNWRPIPGWPYEASETGEIRDSQTGRVLKPQKGGHRALINFPPATAGAGSIDGWINPVVTEGKQVTSAPDAARKSDEASTVPSPLKAHEAEDATRAAESVPERLDGLSTPLRAGRDCGQSLPAGEHS